MAQKITDKFPHLQDEAALEALLLKHTVDSARAEGVDARIVDGKIVVFGATASDSEPIEDESQSDEAKNS